VRRALAVCLAVAATAGCGGSGRPAPTAAEERALAVRFARAVVRGEPARAAALVDAGDATTQELARRLAAASRGHSGTLRLPASRTAPHRWQVAYVRRIPGADGAFERETGRIVVELAGGAVADVAIRDRELVLSTHHDAQLLPSKR